MRILDEADTDPRGAEAAVAGLFEARYPELVRLAGLLGADDPEDIAQEAFARLLGRYGSLRDADAALGYVRATVCNLTRNRQRHLRVVRLRTPAERPPDAESSEQAAVAREEQREVPSSSGGRGGLHGRACAFPDGPKKVPVVGVQISAKVTVGDVTIWWTRIPENMYPQAHADLVMCQFDAVHGGYGQPESPLGQGQLVRASAPFSGFGGGTSMSGIAAASVTSVEADLANGNVERGGLAYGAGFPYAVWWLTYPQGIGATVVFRDAAAQAVKEVAEPYPPASALKHPVPLTATSAATGTICLQNRVQQVMDGIKVWTYISFTVPQAVQPNHAKPTLCEVTGIAGAESTYTGTYTMPAGQAARTFFALYPTSSVSGIVLPSATSVTAVLADGRQYSGTIVTNKLFTYLVWIISYPLKDPATLVFRDATGAQVAVLSVPANPQP